MKYFIISLSALFMSLSQQPIGCGWLAWVSLIPLIHFLYNSISLKEKVYISILWGIVYHSSILFWMIFNLGTTKFLGLISLILATLVLSVNIIFIGILYHLTSKNKIIKTYYYIPIIWVSIEYLRTFLILGFPWVSIANSQVHYNILAQNVEVTGIYGISFWIALINVLFYDLYGKFNNRKLTRVIIVFIFPWISGYALYYLQDKDRLKPINIISVQPNIHLNEKRNPKFPNQNIEKLIRVGSTEINKNTDLILFPETALSIMNLYSKSSLKLIKESILDNNISLLTGLNYFEYGFDNERINYNSIIHLNSENMIQSPEIYHKIKLVPLAERMPLVEFFPSLKSINIGQANFEPGDEYKVFNIKSYKIGAMVCYESTFPQLNRNFVNNGAEILMYFVNDGWYENPPQPQQHAKQSIYRAIEFRRPIVRCANTGISQVIDKTGNIIHEIELNNEGAIAASISPSSSITFYAKYGDVFAIINVLLLSILLGLYFKRKE